MFKILRNIKNIFVHIRSSLKFIFLLIIATVLIIGVVSLVYKPLYSVSIDGEFVGYTSNKSKLQKQINEYIEKGDGEQVSFIDIEVLPEYSLCLAKKETETSDEVIFEKIKEAGTAYYKYYAIILDNEEKQYVKTKEEAEGIIDALKEKKSDNINKIAYTEVNSTELKEFSESESIVTALFVAPKPVVVATGGAGSAKLTDKTYKPDLGISFIKPTSGTITARYRQRGYESHTGLDIAASTGTPIYAAAGGTVTAAGQSGSGYGTYVKISHGNGVETLYAHCSSINVSKGDTVSQGQKIAGMGSTGRSTGTHLHLEIRYNGLALNPENYVY